MDGTAPTQDAIIERDTMDRAPGKILILPVLVALALTLAACSSPQPTVPAGTTGTPAATSSVEPTTPAQAAPAVSSGPITTPANGTALRSAILAAASKGLGVSGGLTVIQLFAQGSAAVGDLQPATGSRMFFALTGGPDHWSIVWSARFGSALANADAMAGAAPLVSPELAARIVWNKKVAKAKPATANTPSLSSFEAFAMKAAKNMGGDTYTGTFTITARIAKDSKGVWWGNANAEPSVEGLEPIGVWGKYSGGKWTGEIADFSEEDAEAAFFPAEVLSKLALP